MKTLTIASLACILGFTTASPIIADDISNINATESAVGESGITPLAICTFQAFSGNECDSGAGSVITISGGVSTCIGTGNRHSYQLSAGCPAGTTYLYANKGCSTSSPYETQGHSPGQQCYNVNLGTNWQSAQFAVSHPFLSSAGTCVLTGYESRAPELSRGVTINAAEYGMAVTI